MSFKHDLNHGLEQYDFPKIPSLGEFDFVTKNGNNPINEAYLRLQNYVNSFKVKDGGRIALPETFHGRVEKAQEIASGLAIALNCNVGCLFDKRMNAHLIINRMVYHPSKNH